MRKQRGNIGMGRTLRFGLPQGWMKTEPPPKPKFGPRLDWDPVLDPIAGRKRPRQVERWRMENWGAKDYED